MTEEIVKKSTVQYLKSYYRFRPRFQHDETLAPTLAQTDMMTSNGIFADGHLSFLDEKGKLFVATFEATSEDSAFEVKFRLEKNLLFWDGIAVSSLLTALLFTYFYAFQNAWLGKQNGGFIFAALVFIALIINILYRFACKNWERYRSIFAIEQFKQYFADEQWIAISNTIFNETNDVYFQELKNQCVFNGFGLLMLNDDNDIQLLITPAREVVYGKKRKKIPFFSNLIENNYTQKAVSWTQSLGQRIVAPITEHSLLRFHRPYYSQWALTGLASVIMIVTMVRFLDLNPIKIANEKEFAENVRINTKDIPEENAIQDSLPIRPFNKKTSTYQDELAITEPMPALTQEEFTERGAAEDGVYMMSEDGKLNYYDCSRLHLEGNNFVVMESVQNDLASAQQRQVQLKAQGILTNCVWLGCFTKSNLNYVIFYDMIYENKKEAEKKKAEFVRLLTSKNIDGTRAKVVSLTL